MIDAKIIDTSETLYGVHLVGCVVYWSGPNRSARNSGMRARVVILIM